MVRTLFNPHDAFMISVAAGYIKGFDSSIMTGAKINPLANVQVDMFLFTDNYIFPPDSGESMEMVSVGADTAEIAITGLDGTGAFKQEAFSLNGLTPVDVGLWSAINGAVNLSPVAVVNLVSIRTTGGAGNTYAQIRPEDQITKLGCFVTAKDETLMLVNLIASMEKATGGDTGALITLYVLLPGSNVRVFGFALGLQRSGTTSPDLASPLPENFPARSKLIFTVESSSATAEYLTRASLLRIKE